jgi:hypothetical protein
VTGTGIDCGGDCTETYDNGVVVALTATPDPGSTFAGWSGGGCSGTASCQVTMDADQTVSAMFAVAADTTPPGTTITTEPKAKLRRTKAKYKFTSSAANSTFVCKFDKEKPKPCDAGRLKLKHLTDGKHKFSVYAVDAAGNADQSPAKDKFKVL